MKNFLRVTFILVMAAGFAACGQDESASHAAAISAGPYGDGPYGGNCPVAPGYTDEYDCNQMTKVVYATVLDTLWNGPASGQFIADIKNVDVTREKMQQYIGSGERLRFQVFVRSWVDLGAKTRAITVIDKNQPADRSVNKGRYVGRDDNGQYIYMLSVPANFGVTKQVYLEIDYQGRTHYSNVGQPQVFFELHTRGV